MEIVGRDGYYYNDKHQPIITICTRNDTAEIMMDKRGIFATFTESGVSIQLRNDEKLKEAIMEVIMFMRGKVSVLAGSMTNAILMLFIVQATNDILVKFQSEWPGFCMWFREHGEFHHRRKDWLPVYVTLMASHSLIHQDADALTTLFKDFTWDFGGNHALRSAIGGPRASRNHLES